MSRFWARWIQSTPHPAFLRSILILSSHVRIGLPSCLLPSCFPTKSCTNRPSSPYVLHPRPPYSSWLDQAVNNWWELHIMNFLIVQFPPLPCYLGRLGLKYLSQHPILEHPQPMFLPQCDRPNFTQSISPSARNLWMLRKMVSGYGVELLAPRPIPKLEYHPFSVVFCQEEHKIIYTKLLR